MIIKDLLMMILAFKWIQNKQNTLKQLKRKNTLKHLKKQNTLKQLVRPRVLKQVVKPKLLKESRMSWVMNKLLNLVFIFKEHQKLKK